MSSKTKNKNTMHCLRKLDPNTIITINVNNEASNAFQHGFYKNTATHTTKSGLRVINGKLFIYPIGRRGGLMVSALDSGSGGPGSSPGRGTALCSWARYFTLIVPLSTQVLGG